MLATFQNNIVGCCRTHPCSGKFFVGVCVCVLSGCMDGDGAVLCGMTCRI